MPMETPTFMPASALPRSSTSETPPAGSTSLDSILTSVRSVAGLLLADTSKRTEISLRLSTTINQRNVTLTLFTPKHTNNRRPSWLARSFERARQETPGCSTTESKPNFDSSIPRYPSPIYRPTHPTPSPECHSPLVNGPNDIWPTQLSAPDQRPFSYWDHRELAKPRGPDHSDRTST